MDTSKEYIKMCRKANLEWNPELYDLYVVYNPKCYRGNGYSGIEQVSGYYKQFKKSAWKKLIFDSVNFLPNGDESILVPVWRQDQLQDMAWDELGAYCSNKMNSLTWGVWDFYNTIDDVDSMEQLWLAFVQWELYGKKWDGGDWKPA